MCSCVAVYLQHRCCVRATAENSSFLTPMNITRRCCGVSAILAPPRRVTTYLLTFLLSVGVTQGEADDNDDDDDDDERQAMHGLIVEHAYTVNASTTVSQSQSLPCRLSRPPSSFLSGLRSVCPRYVLKSVGHRSQCAGLCHSSVHLPHPPCIRTFTCPLGKNLGNLDTLLRQLFQDRVLTRSLDSPPQLT